MIDVFRFSVERGGSCDDRRSGISVGISILTEQTISNFGEHSGPAEGKVSKGAKYTVDGSEGGNASVIHHMRYVLVS